MSSTDITATTKRHIHTLIISDVHLGAIVSRADALAEFLTSVTFDTLVLLGDFLDSDQTHKLSESHWRLIALMGNLKKIHPDINIVWVRGNHDRDTADTMAQHIGADVVDEYAWRINGKKYLAVHGDQFARAIILDDLFLKIGQKFHPIFQYFDRKARHIVPFVEKFHNGMRRTSARVARGAKRYGRSAQVDYIFCGHTHKAIARKYFGDSNPLYYFNTGSWTRTPSSFITIDESGKVSLEHHH